MANFGPKLLVNPFGKMSVFRLFELFVFIGYKGFFFVLEYRKRHFPAPYYKKKKVEKRAIFRPKPWVNPSGKNVSFSTFRTSFYYCLEKPFFVLEYRKRHFPGLYCLKKKLGKIANFGPKLWVNPFGKMSVFRLFELFVFIGYKGVFSM